MDKKPARDALWNPSVVTTKVNVQIFVVDAEDMDTDVPVFVDPVEWMAAQTSKWFPKMLRMTQWMNLIWFEAIFYRLFVFFLWHVLFTSMKYFFAYQLCYSFSSWHLFRGSLWRLWDKNTSNLQFLTTSKNTDIFSIVSFAYNLTVCVCFRDIYHIKCK